MTKSPDAAIILMKLVVSGVHERPTDETPFIILSATAYDPG